MTVCHLIGNGPSSKLFDQRSGDVYGCNHPRLKLPYKACGFVDPNIPYWVKMTGHVGDWEWWTHELLFDHVKQHDLIENVKDGFEFMPNAGMGMAKKLATMYDEVHLWGFDSIFSKKTHSITDGLHSRQISMRKDYLHEWWQVVFEKDVAPLGNFVCHTPTNIFTQSPIKGVQYVPTEAPDQAIEKYQLFEFVSMHLNPLKYCYRYAVTDDSGDEWACWYGDQQVIAKEKKRLEDEKNAEAQEVRDT